MINITDAVLASTLKERPQKAEVEFFISKMVENKKGEKYRLTSDDAKFNKDDAEHGNKHGNDYCAPQEMLV